MLQQQDISSSCFGCHKLALHPDTAVSHATALRLLHLPPPPAVVNPHWPFSSQLMTTHASRRCATCLQTVSTKLVCNKSHQMDCSNGMLGAALCWGSGCSMCCCLGRGRRTRRLRIPSLLSWQASRPILSCTGRTSCCGPSQRCLPSASTQASCTACCQVDASLHTMSCFAVWIGSSQFCAPHELFLSFRMQTLIIEGCKVRLALYIASQ